MLRRKQGVDPAQSVRKVLIDNGVSVVDTPRTLTDVKIDVKDGNVILSAPEKGKKASVQNRPIQIEGRLLSRAANRRNGRLITDLVIKNSGESGTGLDIAQARQEIAFAVKRLAVKKLVLPVNVRSMKKSGKTTRCVYRIKKNSD